MSHVAPTAPVKDPLTSRDRRIIGEIIGHSPESIKTIWQDDYKISVWVEFIDGGQLVFDWSWFATRVAEVKATLTETPLERNERLSAELESSCIKFGLWHGEVDWLCFSTKLYKSNQTIGFVGYDADKKMWTAKPRQYGLGRFAKTLVEAIALLGVKAAVAA